MPSTIGAQDMRQLRVLAIRRLKNYVAYGVSVLTTVCTAFLVPFTTLCATFFAVIVELLATFFAVRTGPA